ncbi:MAG TPA: Crp/Fnr family transcriptional regulator [Solirubrobacteraceae bacterium]
MLAGTFLARLGEPEQAALRELGIARSFPSGAVLMFQDEHDERLMLLLGGRVKVTRSASGEHELLLAIRDRGELLGELAFIDGLPRVATVTALEPVEAAVIGGREFRAHLEAHPAVALALLESLSVRFRESTVKRLQFAASDTLGRLASRILELAELYGEQAADGLAVAMPISQEELASWTGASRAGVAQALQTMRQLGWLSTDRRSLVVHDVDALRERAA